MPREQQMKIAECSAVIIYSVEYDCVVCRAFRVLAM
jgi:hypothetical protein